MYHIFIHLVSGHLGCYHVLAVVDSAALDIGDACVFFELKVLPRYMTRSGMIGSYGS